MKLTSEHLRIATPCKANWDEMTGDDRARFCGECKLTVYNISEMTSDEAHTFLSDQTGRTCARIYQRADGTIITRDCPAGVWRKRRLALIGTGLAAALAFVGTAFGLSNKKAQCASPNAPQSVLSEVQPFKTIVKFVPWLAPPAPPAPVHLKGDVAYIPPAGSNSGNNGGGSTP
jgi:hypothetical protein